MIPDPENGETSSKSNPARRFLSPFTEDRIRTSLARPPSFTIFAEDRIRLGKLRASTHFLPAFTIFAEDRRLFGNLGE
jgi:hypothetical protein